ncbi:hypothetical protein V6N11_020180 [Hibiscus sabdariffa]|uniref:Uncharacterized protein n=1 Tax=Hibiscus sabdariffa TaxID=183260 RepID=A0ABR1ZD24_9ROSI
MNGIADKLVALAREASTDCQHLLVMSSDVLPLAALDMTNDEELLHWSYRTGANEMTKCLPREDPGG